MIEDFFVGILGDLTAASRDSELANVVRSAAAEVGMQLGTTASDLPFFVVFS
jgi:hypothetical protein